VEAAIFNSRWLLAPFYLGLVISLLVLLLKFLRILYDFVTHAWGASESDIILGVLSLIDVTLTANLVAIVVFSGYENFVSRIDPAGHPDWPEWMRYRFLRPQAESDGLNCCHFCGRCSRPL
jgi:uncharacterized protein (TIGR00645 family)